jgi:hypothetical protein
MCKRQTFHVSESYDSVRNSWACREDFGIERNQSFKENDGNAQFSLCCTSTAMPDDDSQDRHPAFCLYEKIESGCNGCEATARLSKQEPWKPVEAAVSAAMSLTIFQSAKHVRRQAANDYRA